ncbi:MAG: GtrA family protein [Bacillota bacterium]
MIRYVITGLSSAAIEFTLLYVFKDMAGLSVITANSAALSIVFWFNFLMNRYWSFKSTMKLQKQLVMYLLLFLFNLLASDAIMYLLVEKLSIQYLFAKVLSIGAMVCWNFILYKKVIYK